MEFSIPLLVVDQYLWTTRSQHPFGFNWQKLDKLAGLQMAGVLDYSYGSSIDKVMKSGLFKVHEVNKVEQIHQMLLRERVDFIISNEDVTQYYLQQNSLKNTLIPSKHSLFRNTYHLALRKNSQAVKYLPLINDIITDLQLNGEIKRIKIKYLEGNDKNAD